MATVLTETAGWEQNIEGQIIIILPPSVVRGFMNLPFPLRSTDVHGV